jgi:hypothetical protein
MSKEQTQRLCAEAYYTMQQSAFPSVRERAEYFKELAAAQDDKEFVAKSRQVRIQSQILTAWANVNGNTDLQRVTGAILKEVGEI